MRSPWPKTQHRPFIPQQSRGMGNFAYRIRRPLFILVLLIIIPCYIAQGMANFTYGNEAVANSPGTPVYEAEQQMNAAYGKSNMMIALVPLDSSLTEKAMTDEIDDLPYVKYALSLSSVLPEGIPEDFLPENITSIMHSKNWARVIINVRSSGESDDAFKFADNIRGIVDRYYPNEQTYLVGVTPSTQDIKSIIVPDYNRVNIVSLLGVALVVALLTPLSMLVAAFISKRTFSLFHEQSTLAARETAVIDESVSGGAVVKAYSREDAITADFDELNEEYRKTATRAVFYSSITNPSTRFVNSLVYCGVALAGGLMAVANPLVTAGQISTLLYYAHNYAKPFNELSDVIAELQSSLASAARVFELLDTPDEPDDIPSAVAIDPASVKGSVAAENAAFSYTERPFMEGIDFDVKPGMRVAVVGPTGCGKTTLINLFMRFYETNAGTITVDGKDIRHITRDSLRASFGMVLQDTWLKSGTVRENIAMGKPDTTDEEIEAAARASHAHSFIKRLPKGYDTPLSEDGGQLSQGQKQLLCITRVMLALPPMLILDEATSSIDTRTEIKIQKAFAELMRGRTSFIVAHRLSTIRNADKIIVIHKGVIEEEGSHEELLEKRGRYYGLYANQ